MREVQAAVIERAGAPVSIETLSLADPGPEEVLVRMTSAGVCHSDLHVRDGHWQRPGPIVMGHEGAGIIETVGAGVDPSLVGRSAALSWYAPCLRCRECQRGRQWLCSGSPSLRHAQADGTTRLARPNGSPVLAYLSIGTMAEAEVVPASAVVPMPDGVPRANRAAYARSNYHTDIWRLEVGSRRPPEHPVLASTQVDEAPQFSPDGARIAFSSTRGSKNSQIWICDVDGTGCIQVTAFNSSCGTPRWSPDSQRLVFDAGEAGQSDLYVTEVRSGVSRRLTFHGASDVVPSWSRDGASIYFTSDRTGAYEVWRMPGSGGPAVQVTRGGGFAAFESPDGREVYFTRYAKAGLWAVPASGGLERSVLDQPVCWGYWALGRKGVFVMDSSGPRGPHIALRRWGGTRLEHVADVPSDPACGESGLALSPDETTLLYVGITRDSDIVMLDGFR